ncbi:DNA-3-methyladenine glycosylase I [Demequina soli]|uniref:DNA-3-methyladenine glycosylase I n=1 Tax=Demequina soli TaxID=1638987 RepID=UPI000785065E|nr:DNA-3-methyladenine glycosylase I [Demequina soli]
MITETNDLVRCFGAGDPLYERYHDEEWGLPVHGDAALLERIVLEGAQSGLAWITILRKREGYRQAFAGFEPEAIAAFRDADVERLMDDAGIVRNRRKIESAIVNARATVALQEAGGSLDALFWSHAPEPRPAAPAAWSEVPTSTPESVALAKDLKKAGFVFVGPTTMYAAMQACGLVDDHIAGCVAARG